MLDRILSSFKKNPALPELIKTLEVERKALVHGLGGSSGAFLAAALLEMDRERSILAVFPYQEEAEQFREDVESVIGKGSVLFFPERDTNPYEYSDSHIEVRSNRVETLHFLENRWKGLVVATAGAVHDPATPPGLIDLVGISIKKGQTTAPDKLVRQLIDRGFKRTNTVASPGQVAIRGGIVDVYPFASESPYRIEFWGDEVESVRTFSTSTQRSLEQLQGFEIIPPDEFVTAAGIDPAHEKRMAAIENETGISLDKLRDAFLNGDRFEGIEQYLHVVFGNEASLHNYFEDRDIVLVSDPLRCMHSLETKFEKTQEVWERLRHDDTDLPSPEYFLASPGLVYETLGKLRLVEILELKPPRKQYIEFGIVPSRQYQSDLREVVSDITNARRKGNTCLITCDNKGQMDRLEELLEEATGDFSMEVAHISGGFTDNSTRMMVLTDHEIFNRYRRRTRYRKIQEGLPIPDYRTLNLGEFVVHVDYGIGKYMGIRRVHIRGAETDCLLVVYRDNDQLLVPVSQLGRIKKFTTEEGVVPVVSKLGGTAWEKLKERTKKSIRKLAEDLLKLYAERKTYPGFAFVADESMMRSFEDSFVYEATADQIRTWEEVRRDMESPSPMERLICGDVGFGKTEIAMRASFLAVLNNKQVALLVPTTILADQHEETFRERFADYPVRIESLSRFRTAKQQKETLDNLARGKVDIVIGTHRLLSKDVHFRELGLLIIDEEQRFGVKAKERLKKLRSNVDVLAMSATPIPRTLNMSLLGARDISYINTPPHDRYSVHTEILPFEEKYIIEATLREIDREGQIYFVHNRVKSIQSMASYLNKLLPNVSFAVAHGQMRERDLEKVMRDFHHRKFQVLVSTMIIENGLDIPNVNTIIINRADNFGLSHLYQLRGRVGRSNRRAFAYLLIPPKTPLSKIARQRLRTIEEFAELGSGFKIAMRDLEIRGAGNILGTEQSGFIAAVGFDLYVDLLNETIAELKGVKLEKPPEVTLTVHKDAYIPETYVPDPAERVLFYRRLSETVRVEDVGEIEKELIDRYGRPSEPVKNLLESQYIRHYAAGLGASDVVVNEAEAIITVPQSLIPGREMVENLVKKAPVKLGFSFENGMQIHFKPPSDEDGSISGTKKVLQALNG